MHLFFLGRGRQAPAQTFWKAALSSDGGPILGEDAQLADLHNFTPLLPEPNPLGAPHKGREFTAIPIRLDAESSLDDGFMAWLAKESHAELGPDMAIDVDDREGVLALVEAVKTGDQGNARVALRRVAVFGRQATATRARQRCLWESSRILQRIRPRARQSRTSARRRAARRTEARAGPSDEPPLAAAPLEGVTA